MVCGLAEHEYLLLQVFVQMDKDLDLLVAGDSCLTVWLWDMDTEHNLKRWIDVFAFAKSWSIAGMTLC